MVRKHVNDPAFGDAALGAGLDLKGEKGNFDKSEKLMPDRHKLTQTRTQQLNEGWHLRCRA